MTDCTHAIARPLSLARYPAAGDDSAGVSVWMLLPTTARQPRREVADRFVVATAPVAVPWRGSVDVVLAASRATVDEALVVPVGSGCALVATPVTGVGIALRLRDGDVVVVPERVGACGICLYPWLALSAGLAGVTDHRLDGPTAVPTPRRGSAAR
jgi:hypothetical protein